MVWQYNIFLVFMSKPGKRLRYSEFKSLSVEERLIQSQYFKKNKPTMVPVILFTKSKDLNQLPNCKFLMNVDRQLYGELNQLKLYIQKNSQDKINSEEAYFFSHNNKVLGGNLKVNQFMNKSYKDSEGDGWIYIEYSKQGNFGC